MQPKPQNYKHEPYVEVQKSAGTEYPFLNAETT